MKRIIILLLMIFLLTGCAVKENIKVNRNLSVEENIEFSESMKFFNSRFKMLPINIIKDILYSNDRDKILKENGYDFKIETSSNYPYVTASKKYSNIEDFTNNTIFKSQYFNNVTTSENNNLISINANDFIFHDEQDIDYYYVDNLYISISLPYVVTDNNADRYKASTNTYTWVIDEKTENKEIKITFDKTRIYIYNIGLYISIGIVVLLIIIGIFIILKMRRKNIKMNRL